jgi:C_GCAxxG_C_C family probable redox protein
MRKTCGAVTGAAMCLGLSLGTDGSEDESELKAKREATKKAAKALVQRFSAAWGSTCCSSLKAMDRGEMEQSGIMRLDRKIGKKCDDYVDWAVNEVISILQQHESI